MAQIYQPALLGFKGIPFIFKLIFKIVTVPFVFKNNPPLLVLSIKKIKNYVWLNTNTAPILI